MLRRSPVPSKWEAGRQKCCKDLANTKLDLRNAANSFQIEGKGGCYLGTQPIGGVGGETEDGTIYTYIYIYTCIYISILYYIYIYGKETFNVQTIIITRKPTFWFAQEDILVGH